MCVRAARLGGLLWREAAPTARPPPTPPATDGLVGASVRHSLHEVWPVALLLALSSATALAALRLLAQLLRTAISAGTPGPPSSLGTKRRSAPALQRAALLLALAPAVSAVVEAAGRALQASAVGVCSEASFAGRQTLAAGGHHTCQCALRAAGGAVGCPRGTRRLSSATQPGRGGESASGGRKEEEAPGEGVNPLKR